MALRPNTRSTRKLALAAALAIAVAGIKGRPTRFEVAEASMEPALQPGDYLVAVLARTVGRGDIVVYPDPARPGQDLIKRVVGLPGETVAITGGQVVIDGMLLAEPWADGPTLPDGEWTNQTGTIFALGDNRRMSVGDSRSTGPISTTGLYQAVWRYWPLGSVGRV
jgi:signal peptidase I